ncbi:MAG: hypothetical protein KDD60_01985 [Bdellovibrionales bacterium]|nr:hypothetical protein [Bdellovibrionales bacterium]
MNRILFICSTNTSLSPLAVAIAQNMLATEASLLTFHSAGTHAGKTARTATHTAIEYARLLGIDLASHRSRQISQEMINESQLVLCMSEEQFWFVKDEFNISKNVQLRMITEFSAQLGVREIADPLLGECTYDYAVEWLTKSLQGLFQHLQVTKA